MRAAAEAEDPLTRQLGNVRPARAAARTFEFQHLDAPQGQMAHRAQLAAGNQPAMTLAIQAIGSGSIDTTMSTPDTCTGQSVRWKASDGASIPVPESATTGIAQASAVAVSPTLPELAVFTLKMCMDFKAVTDRGRDLPLFLYETLALPVNGKPRVLHTDAEREEFALSAERLFLKNTKQDVTKLVRLIDSGLTANCHGWVFAEGRFGVDEVYVPTILEDHKYSVVKEPRPGDLAIYEQDGTVMHSGIVGEWSHGGRLLIQSKWGPFGVYLHSEDVHPFHGECVFYRSQRPSPTLTICQA